MDTNDIPTAPPRAGTFTRLAIRIAGTDEETLKRCPAADWDNIRAVATIMICVWIYQTALFTLCGHKLFAAPGAFRPDLLIAAAFIATFFMAFDSFAVIRSGWYSQGLQLLKSGGLDISGGAWARVKAGLFLTVRILLSVALAQLTAIFLSLILFGADVSAQLHASYLQANSSIIADATARADAEIQRATDSVKAEETRYDAMAGQVAAARQSEVDPAGGDAQVKEAQKELDGLLAEKAKADAAVTAAETFATNELGGIKGAPENSGQPGPGYRHKAALQRLADAKAHARDLAQQVDVARNRLDAIRKQRGAAGLATAQQVKQQLPSLENALKDQAARLTAARDHLASLIQNRDQDVRQSVEAASGYVPADTGLLAQLTALEHVAGDDTKIKAVIILVELVSFGFELAAVLATVTAYVPTTYAALLVADNYAAVVRVVEQLAQKIEQGSQQPDDAEIMPPGPQGDIDGAMADEPAHRSDLPTFGPDPFGSAAAEPLKRPRGRPRKPALN